MSIHTMQGHEIDYEKNRENDLVRSAVIEEQRGYIVVRARGKRRGMEGACSDRNYLGDLRVPLLF